MVAVVTERGTDTDRTMEEGVQHDPATQLARIPATSSGGNHAGASDGRKSEIITGNAIGGRSVLFRAPEIGSFSRMVLWPLKVLRRFHFR
jgi:hypothetical protein